MQTEQQGAAGVAGAPISYTINGAVQATGVSRALLYEALKAKELTARKARSRTLIEHSELTRWVNNLPTIGRQPDAAAA